MRPVLAMRYLNINQSRIVIVMARVITGYATV